MNVALYMFHVKIKVFEMIIMWAVMNVIYCKGLDDKVNTGLQDSGWQLDSKKNIYKGLPSN